MSLLLCKLLFAGPARKRLFWLVAITVQYFRPFFLWSGMVEGCFYPFQNAFFPHSFDGMRMGIERLGNIRIFPSSIWLVFIYQKQDLGPSHPSCIPFAFTNNGCQLGPFFVCPSNFVYFCGHYSFSCFWWKDATFWLIQQTLFDGLLERLPDWLRYHHITYTYRQ